MKHLLILLLMSTLVSCGIKDLYLNSTSGSLGIPKQPILPTEETTIIAQPSNQTSQTQDSEKINVTDTFATEKSEEPMFKWYYIIPFIGLAILAFLVYRLKQQNMKSL